jgi:hypothetical protein
MMCLCHRVGPANKPTAAPYSDHRHPLIRGSACDDNATYQQRHVSKRFIANYER